MIKQHFVCEPQTIYYNICMQSWSFFELRQSSNIITFKDQICFVMDAFNNNNNNNNNDICYII